MVLDDDHADPQGASSVLWKAFDVLAAFSSAAPVLTLSEISRRSGLPKSTVHRVLGMLLALEAVERVGPKYKVGLRMFSMGALSVDSSLRDIALPHLERLRRITRRTVHIAVLQGPDVIYLDKLPSLASPATPALVGGRFPAHRTAVGKVLLAFEDHAVLSPGRESIRYNGVGSEHEEAARGLACVAVPVLVGGRAAAAISVAFAADESRGDEFVNPLRQAAAALGRSAVGTPIIPS